MARMTGITARSMHPRPRRPARSPAEGRIGRKGTARADLAARVPAAVDPVALEAADPADAAVAAALPAAVAVAVQDNAKKQQSKRRKARVANKSCVRLFLLMKKFCGSGGRNGRQA